jgi:hypothetical protein
LSPTFFKPYQAYLGGVDVLQTHDFSNYNGLQVQFEHRFSRGFSLTANYTYSKALDIRSFDPTFTLVATGSSQSAAGTPFDYHHPRLNYAASDLDSAQVISGYYVYDLPFGRDRKYGSHWNYFVDLAVGRSPATASGRPAAPSPSTPVTTPSLDLYKRPQTALVATRTWARSRHTTARHGS